MYGYHVKAGIELHFRVLINNKSWVYKPYGLSKYQTKNRQSHWIMFYFQGLSKYSS